MQGLIGPLKELAEFEELCKNKKKDVGMIRVCGCVNSQKSHMMYALGDGCKYKVIACSSETKAKQIYEEYRFLDSNTYLYPAKDFLFYQADIRSKELVKQRMEGIQAVLSGEPVTVVTSLDGFMDHLAPKESIAEKVLKIQNDSVLKLDEMAEKLSVIGYDREVQVEGPGQFAVRGGILDIYPLTEELPVRIELWGDEVDSIRTFDVESQRSIENLMDIVIYPAVEFPQNGEKGVSFLDYFPPEDTILFLDEPTTYLDIRYQIEILELVKKLNREYGMTVIMVLHEINQAIYFSDRIIGLCQGKVLIQGEPDEVITGESIRQLYGIDLKVTEIDGHKFVLTV